MKVLALIEKGKDGTYGVYIPNNKLPYGIIGDGATVEEAKDDFLNSYAEMKAYYNEIDKPFVEAEFEYQYDTVSFLAFYNQFLTLSGLSKLTGINKAQLSHYIQGYRNPSPATTKRIETALYKFADELKSVQLV